MAMPAVAPPERDAEPEDDEPDELRPTALLVVGARELPAVDEVGVRVLGAGVGRREGRGDGPGVGCTLVGRAVGRVLGSQVGLGVGGRRVGACDVGLAVPAQAGPVYGSSVGWDTAPAVGARVGGEGAGGLNPPPLVLLKTVGAHVGGAVGISWQ